MITSFFVTGLSSMSLSSTASMTDLAFFSPRVSTIAVLYSVSAFSLREYATAKAALRLEVILAPPIMHAVEAAAVATAGI